MADQNRTKIPDPTFDSVGEEVPADFEIQLRADYQREDERWSAASQVRDALIIFAIGVFVFSWMFIVFLFEPGIR
jgi:hypothetical protein